MLKKRIIPVIQYRGMQAVVGRQFNPWRTVGSLRQQVRVYQARGVDELFLLDVAATPEGRGPDFELLKDLCGECFMPVTIGGGIRTVEHIREALASGADKVAVGIRHPDNWRLIRAGAEKFGRQAITAIINHCDDGFPVFKIPGSTARLALEVESYGAGEIVLNSVDRDGMQQGYDLATLRDVAKQVSIPVVPLGGAGGYSHFLEAFEAGAHAVAAGAMFAFSEARPREAAEWLAARGVPTRLD